MRLRDAALGTAARCSVGILGGRYRLDGVLGSGGAADVHRGFDLRLRRPVAVKVFRPGTGFDAEENVHGEGMILARLHHPGLVTAYDAGRHNGRGFLVMQLIEGATLKERIAQGVLSVPETARLGADLADALAHAHEARVIHRDVKPSNILLDAARRPYLTDFGISRLLDATTRTATGTLVGTAAYLSPEQVLGRPVGRASDIYALGLVLLEGLTGRLEYEGGPLEAAIARLHRQPVVPAHLPPELAGLLRDMTALEEAARPAAGDCARVLARYDDTGARPAAEPVALRTPAVPGSDGPPTLDGTPHQPVPGAVRAGTGGPSARGRARTVGVCTALAAVMATAFVVMDHSTAHVGGRDKAEVTSTPAAESGRDGAARKGDTAAKADTVGPTGRDGANGAGDGAGDTGATDRRGGRTPAQRSVGVVTADGPTTLRGGSTATGIGETPARTAPRPPGRATAPRAGDGPRTANGPEAGKKPQPPNGPKPPKQPGKAGNPKP
uniref:serine/threonine-protein kinase n=1 Tax=Streptomyces corallincola TaxID=2851888 RepID=UPI001FE9908D|nr:serine/threonine-protein kinase [Streptomyces corallincola]